MYMPKRTQVNVKEGKTHSSRTGPRRTPSTLSPQEFPGGRGTGQTSRPLVVGLQTTGFSSEVDTRACGSRRNRLGHPDSPCGSRRPKSGSSPHPTPSWTHPYSRTSLEDLGRGPDSSRVTGTGNHGGWGCGCLQSQWNPDR